MKKTSCISLGLAILLALAVGRLNDAHAAASPDADQPQFTADGQLLSPRNYREWIYLSSGLGMTYGPVSNAGAMPDEPRFDNVFVNPSAYRSFLQNGVWPENTLLVLEVRSSATKQSINKGGRSQQDIVGIEAEVKDSKRFAGKWAFFDLSNGVASAKAFDTSAACYACHGRNGAVDNTFVQFYPTLRGIAHEKGTFHESADQ